MKQEIKENLKGLAEVVLIVSGLFVGSALLAKGCGEFDKWQINYIERKEIEQYKKSHPGYQLDYNGERK